jgi:hypothetical protein
LITDLYWTPGTGTAPHCVQTVKRVDWAPEWAGALSKRSERPDRA